MRNTTGVVAAIGTIILLIIANLIYATVAQTTTEIPRWIIIAISVGIVGIVVGLAVFVVRNRHRKGGIPRKMKMWLSLSLITSGGLAIVALFVLAFVADFYKPVVADVVYILLLVGGLGAGSLGIVLHPKERNFSSGAP